MPCSCDRRGMWGSQRKCNHSISNEMVSEEFETQMIFSIIIINVSGLVPSILKSTTFFYNVPNAIKAAILNSMPFAEGTLPVRYLGIPLISSRLLYQDCKVLVEKLESRVNDWKNKFLSLADRLQLVRSMLSSMHIYWASVFILLAHIIHDLEHLMRGFLWCQGDMKKGKAKVAWELVCKPK
ncbi:hypothetical protein Tco_0962546 [Tanacetum coccineum]